MKIKAGQFVRFTTPNADELTPTGRSLIMKVLEVDPPRALVENARANTDPTE